MKIPRPSPLPVPSTPGWLLCSAGLALVYATTGSLGFLVPSYVGHFGLIWLPGGIAVCALFCLGYSCWPGVLVGSLLISYFHNGILGLGLSVAIANTLGPLLAVRLLRRWHFDPAFRHPYDILLLVFAATSGMLVTAGGGTAWLAVLGRIQPREYADQFFSWWASDTLGVVLLTPVLLALLPAGALAAVRARAREFALWALCTIGLGALLLLHRSSIGGVTLSMP